MGEEHEVFIESSVRGHHAYFVDTSVVIGEVLTCERDHDNVHDRYAIAVKNEDQTLVGHVPVELSKIFSRVFTVLELGTMKARGKGLKFPWIINLKEITST